MKLFMFYLGGSAGKSNIEVHDIQFAVSETPEQAWPYLREVWFGDKDKLHIDGFAELQWADGYRITLSQHPSQSHLRLWFVNAGAYRPDELAELHAFDLFVAEDAATARQKALNTLLTGHDQQHKDNLKDVDDCILLEQIGGWYLRLEADPQGQRYTPQWQGYHPIVITSDE